MKTSLLRSLTALVLLALSILVHQPSASAQGTAFAYQGFLTDGGTPANGAYDLTFTLFDAVSGGATVGASNVVNDLGVTNGLFTVALDFGAASFDGSDRWLEIAVRPGASTDAYTNVAPRQPITATPYALRALSFSGAISNAQLAGTYGSVVNITNAANVFAGSFRGNGGGLTNLNAASLVGPLPAAALSNAWRIGGNAGTIAGNSFLGTTDNRPLELRVNNARALQLQPDTSPANAPNVIGGSPVNIIAPGIAGATIAGGGSADYEGNGPAPNTVETSYGTVGGGVGNDTAGVGATIGGGYNNSSAGYFAVVGGGGVNVAHGDYATVGGGLFNLATNTASTVAGGRDNDARSSYSSVGGGSNNQALALSATVAGGRNNVSSGTYSAVGGGIGNFNNGLAATVGGGSANTNSGDYATVSGGSGNTVFGDYATVGGGQGNDGDGIAATVAGGRFNRSYSEASVGGGSYNLALALWSAIGGGTRNTNSGPYATIGGGRQNRAAGFSSTVGGGQENLSTGVSSTVAGGQDNSATNWSSTVSGGQSNRAFGRYSTVGGGFNGLASTDFATVAGGYSNLSSGNYATVGGGWGNRSQGDAATVGGGGGNTSSGVVATVAGGDSNTGSGVAATVGGGYRNFSIGDYATVPGGLDNFAGGNYSLAAGRRAIAFHAGTFVWADSQNADFASTAAQQFLIRAAGGVGIGHTAPDAPLHVVGGTDVNLASGGTLILGSVSGLNIAIDSNEIQARNNAAASSLFLNAGGGNVSIGTATANARLRVVNATCDGEVWNNSSDRNLKAGFETVDAQSILAKVAALPLSRWHYTNAPDTRHIGPMAQDFQAAFGVGSDDKHIATVDADGVALAAIQGLNALLKAQATELHSLKQELTELRRAVSRAAEHSSTR